MTMYQVTLTVLIEAENEDEAISEANRLDDTCIVEAIVNVEGK